MDQKKTGAFIAVCRKEHHMTQMQFAEKLGVTNKAVSKWETGKCLPDASLFDAICLLLNITPNELLAGEKALPQTLKAGPTENPARVAATCRRKAYGAICAKYITFMLIPIITAVNVRVGGAWFEGSPVLSNLVLTVLLVLSCGVLTRLTRNDIPVQKVIFTCSAFLFVSAVIAFVLAFWDIDPKIVFWSGLPCEALFYGLKLVCNEIILYAIAAFLAAATVIYSKHNIRLSTTKREEKCT